MANSLDSMGGEFWYAEGEPYDRIDNAVNKKDQPISVWSAVCMALDDPKTREYIESWLNWNCSTPATYKKFFIPGRKINITPEIVMEAIQKVNTCGDLRIPVDCWVEETGWCRIEVYD